MNITLLYFISYVNFSAVVIHDEYANVCHIPIICTTFPLCCYSCNKKGGWNSSLKG